MDQLIRQLISERALKTPAIIEAFKTIHRRDFLPPDVAPEESINAPLPIGGGQTNSQPFTVAFMLELLQPQAGQKVLDVGSGSGWTTALLAHLVGPRGKVYAIERVAELKAFGEGNVGKYTFSNVEFFCRDGHVGLSDAAPFARILVSAASRGVPEALKQQLAIGGRLVIPTTREDIRLLVRESGEKFSEERFEGFVFVPLVNDQL